MNEREIFTAAKNQADPTCRAALLDEACAGDASLRKSVESLLAEHEQLGCFLETRPPAAISGRVSLEGPGTLIGRYKLLEQVGEGGMGIVFVAEQTEPVRRRVALKIIKPGMDTKQVIARFEAERQALAMMDHPNIARVLDAGATDAGRPYFVMELVRGMPITEYCDKAKLSPRQRLELFIDVCQAVQHAHQKGIIHRDLKPSNVMITLHDGTPVVKVIDFGVAKAVGQQLTERTIYTALTQLVGTPLYMSPEQAEMSGLDVDTRSDVYSLGVLLYELLTGQTPFDKETLSKAGLDEMRRIIREDEPLRPSRRFSTLGAEAISTASQHRGLDERKLTKILCGELDWIVMKALEKDRSRRYESASSLAADIQRYLSDEPVLACPPTTMYRFQKFARKHKPALATAAVIAASLILGTTVSAWQAVRATTAEAQATANEAQAKASSQEAKEKAQEAKEQAQVATTQRDEAQRQRDEVQRQRDEIKALSEKLLTTQQDLQRSLYAAHINLAQRAWDEAAVPRTLSLLQQHRPKPGETDLRGFEWHYLNRLCRADEPLTLKRQAGVFGIFARAAFSPDGKRLLTFTGPGTGSLPKALPRDAALTIWDTQTGQEVRTFDLKGGGRTAVFSPDVKRLASGLDTEKIVKVWDTETGRELLSLPGGGMRNYGSGNVVFSPDGKRLLCAEEAGVKVWNAETGQELLTLKGAWLPADISQDGKRLVASGGTWNDTKKAWSNWKLKVWDAETGQPLVELPGEWRSVAFSPDGKQVLGINSAWDAKQNKYLPGEMKVWDAETGKEPLNIKEPIEGFNTIAFSPDGKRFATDDGSSHDIKVRDAQTGQVIHTFQGHTEWVSHLAFSPNSALLASRSNDRTMRIWDLQTGQEARTLRGHTGAAFVNSSLAFSLDGNRLAIANGAELTVWNWDAQKDPKDQRTLSLQGISRQSFTATGDTSVVFSPDFGRLAGISNKMVRLFDARDGQEILTLKGHANNVMCLAFSLDGKRLASGDGVRSGRSFNSVGKPIPGMVKVWDAQTGEEIFSLAEHASCVLRVAFSPDGKHLASISEDQTVKVWDTQAGQVFLSISPKEPQVSPFASLAFSPDGKRLASAGMGPIKVWDAQTGQELATFRGGIGGIAFSPDGKRLTSTGGIVRVLDSQTGQLLLSTSENIQH